MLSWVFFYNIISRLPNDIIVIFFWSDYTSVVRETDTTKKDQQTTAAGRQ